MHSLEYLALIWAGALAAVLAARATRLTPVVYYLGAGAVLVNLGLLPADPDPFIRTLSEVGIVLIMFALGFDEDASTFLKSIRRSWGITFFGALAPFVVTYSLAITFWGEPRIALLCALALCATAVSITVVSLRGEGLQSSRVATRILTSAVLDSVASLALVAIAIPLVTGQVETLSVASVGGVVIKTILFFSFVFVVGILVERFRLFRVFGFERGHHAILQLLLLALVIALVGHHFGFHPAVGAYMAGLMLKPHYFGKDRPAEDYVGSFADTHRIIDNVAFSWIGPIFFVELGSRIILDLEIVMAIAPWVFALAAGIAFVQVGAAGLAAHFTGGMDPAGSLMIGLGMLGRAELAFVVMDIGYVQFEIFSREVFYTLMGTCFLLNVTVPIAIHLWKPHYDRAQDKLSKTRKTNANGDPLLEDTI